MEVEVGNIREEDVLREITGGSSKAKPAYTALETSPRIEWS
jgi:hypothetical protein